MKTSSSALGKSLPGLAACRVFAGVCLLLGTALPGRGQAQAPSEFPKVPLVPNSDPRYTRLGVNPWSEETAYVLFDGTLADGYNRAYVWIPGDPSFGKPVAVGAAGNNMLAPIRVTRSGDGEKAALEWQLKWGRYGGGTHRSFDYATGKTGEYHTTARAEFWYSLSFLKERTGGGDSRRVSLVIGNILGASASFKDAPGPLRPWENLYFGVNIGGKGETEAAAGSCQFRAAIHSARVLEFPEDATVTLVVRPYLEAPVYSNEFSAVEFLRQGVDIPLEYGWYEFMWDAVTDVIPLNDAQAQKRWSGPFPFVRPAAAAAVAE